MDRTLIIITREQREFDSYWNGSSNSLLNGSDIPKPLQISISSSEVIVISPSGFAVANSTEDFGKIIKAVLEACKINLTGKHVGIIVHGSDNFNIHESGLTNLAFRRSYSSTLGAGFCQSANDNFVINHNVNTHRSGVLDAFRDAYILKRESKLEETFNNLWNYFLGDPILESQLNFLHHCLTPEGLKKEEVNSSQWASLKEFKSLTEVMPEEGKTEVDPFGDNYLSALRTLRNKLLVS